MSFGDEIVQDEEIVEDEDETEEVVREKEEKVEVEDETEEVVKEERYKPNAIDKLLALKQILLRDKHAQTLLILNRLEGANLTRISKEIHANHKRMRQILRDLESTGYIIAYRKYPDTNTYYKLSEKGKKIAELMYEIITFRW
jgi:predicted transcriptional regulator